jgi:hypothetical protein
VSLNWIAIENALQSWLSAGAGVTVVWEHANAAAPALPYASLLVTRVAPVAGDRADSATNLSNPAGQEVEETAVVPLELSVTARAYAVPTSGSGTARELVANALSALFFPSRREALRASGLVVAGVGDVVDETALVGSTWESRAAMDVRFRCVDTAVAKTGYIANVGLVDQTTH